MTYALIGCCRISTNHIESAVTGMPVNLLLKDCDTEDFMGRF